MATDGFGRSTANERPASPKQRDYLIALLKEAGFDSFADARHPLGLTQKQLKGRFSAPEASAMIDLLLEAQRTGTPVGSDGSASAIDLRDERERIADLRREAEQARMLQGIPADLLADELRRRGWTVTDPTG